MGFSALGVFSCFGLTTLTFPQCGTNLILNNASYISLYKFRLYFDPSAKSHLIFSQCLISKLSKPAARRTFLFIVMSGIDLFMQLRKKLNHFISHNV